MFRHLQRSMHIRALVCACVVAAGALVVIAQSPPRSQEPNPPNTPNTPATARSQARHDAAKRAYEALVGRQGSYVGRGGGEDAYRWSRRWMNAAAETSADGGVAAARAHLDRMRELAGRVVEMRKTSEATLFEVAATEYFVAEAEETLDHTRSKAPPAKP